MILRWFKYSQRCAFDVSPYPVILTIENHASLVQQRLMAEYFTDVGYFWQLYLFSFMLLETEPDRICMLSFVKIFFICSYQIQIRSFQVLGDMLYKPSKDSARMLFPSPNQLKRKFILRYFRLFFFESLEFHFSEARKWICLTTMMKIRRMRRKESGEKAMMRRRRWDFSSILENWIFKNEHNLLHFYQMRWMKTIEFWQGSK